MVTYVHKITHIAYILHIYIWLTLFTEPLLESVPQVFILFALVCQNPDVIYGGDATWFWVTFSTSIVSAAKGIATLLKEGPCKLVPNQGLLGGYGLIGFILLFFNVGITLIGKGSTLLGVTADPSKSQLSMIVAWACFTFLPSLIFVSFLYFFLYFSTFG